MKLKELSQQINKTLKEELGPLGFKKDGFGYVQNINGFSKKIVISSVDRDNSFPTSFAIWIGFLGVEKILHVATNNDNQVNKIKSAGQIFLRQVELFEDEKYPVMEYDIYTLEQAKHALKEILNFFIKNYVLSDKYDSYKKIESIINSPDNTFNSRYLSSKVKYGLILSKLLGNPNYESLKLGYRKLLFGWSDWDIKEVEKVIKFLDDHTIDELQSVIE